MGGAVIERDTTLLPLSLVLKEMNMLTRHLRGEPGRACEQLDAPRPTHRSANEATAILS